MAAVKIEILRITDSAFPIFVECLLVDCNGKKHYFRDKLPVFSSDYNANLPCSGEIRCQIILNKKDTLIIDTSSPDDVESTDGRYEFEVYKNQISGNS